MAARKGTAIHIYNKKSCRNAKKRSEKPKHPTYKIFTLQDLSSFSATKETVYTGEMIASGHRTSKGESLLKGDFTEVSEKGTYYIEAPFIGRSYTFVIDGDYLEILQENLKEVLQNEAESTEGVYLYRIQTLCWIFGQISNYTIYICFILKNLFLFPSCRKKISFLLIL